MSWGSWSPRPPRTWSPSDHKDGSFLEQAQAFIDGGLNPVNRRLGSTSYVVKNEDETISVVYQNTAVVTYMTDGTFQLDHGGWRTVTTATWINHFSPFYIGSTYDRKHPGWRLCDSDVVTPARVWKCRTCSGTLKYGYWEGWGRTRKWHQTNETCWRCDGTGKVDYGSQVVPEVWTSRDGPVRLAVTEDHRNPKLVERECLRYYVSGYQEYQRPERYIIEVPQSGRRKVSA